MSGGAITMISRVSENKGTVAAIETDEYKEDKENTAVFNKVLVDDFGEQFTFGGVDMLVSEYSPSESSAIKRSVPINWEDLLSQLMEEENTVESIWGKGKLRTLLKEEIGSPVELTREEANEIVMLAFGSRPDLPSGKEVAGEMREMLGQSLIERINKKEK